MGTVGGVVEISSDEDDFRGFPSVPADDVGWWSDLLVVGDGGGIGEGLDDLVVMDELSAPPVSQKKGGCDGGRGGNDDDDDDCLVLDGDPDKPISVTEEKGGDGDVSDELQIVAEKGQLACRDFPHPRYVCAGFPFNTTSHSKYCNMCHCYVCDTLAPCTHWGNGTLDTDHCHATDKDARWKTLRQLLKHKNLPASHQEKQVMPLSHQVMLSPRFSVPQPSPSLRSNVGRPSLAGTAPRLNTVGQKQQTHPSMRVSPHPRRAVCVQRATGVPRAGGSPVGSCVNQVMDSRTKFKRVGAAPPGYAIPNTTRSQSAIPRNVQIQRASHMTPRSNVVTGTFHNPPQRSLSTPLASQRPQGQPTASLQLAPGRAHGTPQLSRCTSLTTPRTQCLPELLEDVSSKSWQDILASIASELEVPDYRINTTMAQQSLTTSLPLQSGQLPHHGNPSQGIDICVQSVAAMAHSDSLGGRILSNHATAQNVQAHDTVQSAQRFHELNSEGNLSPRVTNLNSFLASPEDEILTGATHQLESPKLDSRRLYDFELDSWGG